MRVHIGFDIYTSTKRITLAQVRDCEFVPRVGDDVELAKDWSSQPVKRVFLHHDGTAGVWLEPFFDQDDEQVAELNQLVTFHGWRAT